MTSGSALDAAFPDHWRRSRFGALFTESAERNSGGGQGVALSVSEYRGVIKRDDLTGQMQSLDVSEYRVVRPGQLAANVMWLNRSGLGISRLTGYVSPAYKVFTLSDELHPPFIDYLLRSGVYRSEFERLGRGVRPNAQMIDGTDLRAMAVPVPPFAEQCAIADHLDRESAKIDTLIAEQRRLVELLHARHESLIDSVTRGSGGDRFTSTGDEWWPNLPDGWRVARASRLLTWGPQNGVSPEVASADGIPSLSLGSVRAGRVDRTPEVTKLVERSEIRQPEDYVLRPGDILLVRGSGSVNLVGRAGLVGSEFADGEYIYPDLLIRIRVSDAVLPAFFVWALNASATRAQILAKARTAVGTFKIAGGDVRSLSIPVPPLEEQRRIVRHLDLQSAVTDELVAESERLIELSKERKSALITSAVTGQVEIPGGA